MSRVYVAPISFGLGDLAVSLPAIQALIAQGRHLGDEIWLVARSAAQARLAGRIDGLAGWVEEEAFDRDGHDGRLVDLRDHPLQRDWWWGSPEFEDAFGTLSINEILCRICADFGIDADFTRPIPLDRVPAIRAQLFRGVGDRQRRTVEALASRPLEITRGRAPFAGARRATHHSRRGCARDARAGDRGNSRALAR